ncbi:MAG: hypothetical protein WCJ42_03485 [Actinomycetes bacterium]
MAHASTSFTHWFIRILLAVSCLAVVGNDAIAAFAGNVSVIDDANAAALAGRVVLSAGGGWIGVNQAASDYAVAHHDQLVPNSTTINSDGSVTVQLQRRVKTWVLGRLPGIRSVTTLSATGVAAPST